MPPWTAKLNGLRKFAAIHTLVDRGSPQPYALDYFGESQEFFVHSLLYLSSGRSRRLRNANECPNGNQDNYG